MYQAPRGDFDLASATAIPQYDRLGREEFLEILARAQVQIPCDVTESADVPWRRWFCNLGRHSGAVIGHGIRCVRLEALEAEEAAPGGRVALALQRFTQRRSTSANGKCASTNAFNGWMARSSGDLAIRSRGATVEEAKEALLSPPRPTVGAVEIF